MTLSVGYTIMTGILIGASIPHDPLVRPLAIPLPLFFIQVGAMALFTGFMDVRHMSTTCKVSSRPKGVRMPPVLLVFIEDVVAVDGGAGKTYRERLWTRYRVSRVFRRLIRGLNWFWGVGSLLVGAGSLAVVWTVPEEIAYGIGKSAPHFPSTPYLVYYFKILTNNLLGWGAPLVLTIIWTAITVLWTHRSLKAEKESWMDDLKRQAQKRNGNEKPLRQ